MVASCTAGFRRESGTMNGIRFIRTRAYRHRGAQRRIRPLRNLGLIVVDEEHENPTSRRKRRAITRAMSQLWGEDGKWRCRARDAPLHR